MKALRIVAPGRFEVAEVEKPTCVDDQVLIRMRYSALCNQSDSKVFRGHAGGLGWMLPSLLGQTGVGNHLLQFLKMQHSQHFPMKPGSPGHEGSGIVEEIGANVSELSPGDHVTMTGIGGPPLHQQYVTRKAGTAIKISPDVPLEQAAILELSTRETVLTMLGDLEDTEELRQARPERDESLPWYHTNTV